MISVVMPAFNEADFLEPAVREVVDGLAARGHDAEVLVVENGSTDATAEIARDLAQAVPGVRAVSLPTADYGAALRAGFLAARGDVVANVDVDYYDLDFVERTAGMLSADGGPDVVVGSKRAAGADDQRTLLRRLITSVFTLVLRRGFGLRVSDTHGMKAMKRATVLPVVERCRFGTDLFDTELVLRAERAGLGVTEVPVTVRESRPSRTSIVRRGLRTVRGLVVLRLALRADRV
jgi:glycosyltransferase involved in cell wall biosynthesis